MRLTAEKLRGVSVGVPILLSVFLEPAPLVLKSRIPLSRHVALPTLGVCYRVRAYSYCDRLRRKQLEQFVPTLICEQVAPMLKHMSHVGRSIAPSSPCTVLLSSPQRFAEDNANTRSQVSYALQKKHLVLYD
jgi:hypothetical protein